jgi:hypothetical protein
MTNSLESYRCRSCGDSNTKLVMSLGETPLADVLIREEDLQKQELLVPLDLVFCPSCTLVQITETVSPDLLFAGEYPYFATVSSTRMKSAEKLAQSLTERFGLGPESMVMEPGSNDGYLLGFFVEKGIPVLGIDPAPPPAEKANRDGIPTICDFFTENLARSLRSDGKSADVIVGNNVLAHVADLNGFVTGVELLLKDHGVFVAEVAYLGDMLSLTAFDTIYHQHLCYFALGSLEALFRRHGLRLFDVDHLDAQGGSLRVYVGRHQEPTENVLQLREREAELGLQEFSTYTGFRHRVESIRRDLREILRKEKAEGRRIVGYGAAAKATTLISYTGITNEDLEYVVDLNTFKHGRYLPGVRLPIRPPDLLTKDRPDDVLLLAWNYEREVREQEREYVEGGGRFIIPIPKPKVA